MKVYHILRKRMRGRPNPLCAILTREIPPLRGTLEKASMTSRRRTENRSPSPRRRDGRIETGRDVSRPYEKPGRGRREGGIEIGRDKSRPTKNRAAVGGKGGLEEGQATTPCPYKSCTLFHLAFFIPLGGLSGGAAHPGSLRLAVEILLEQGRRPGLIDVNGMIVISGWGRRVIADRAG